MKFSEIDKSDVNIKFGKVKMGDHAQRHAKDGLDEVDLPLHEGAYPTEIYDVLDKPGFVNSQLLYDKKGIRYDRGGWTTKGIPPKLDIWDNNEVNMDFSAYVGYNLIVVGFVDNPPLEDMVMEGPDITSIMPGTSTYSGWHQYDDHMAAVEDGATWELDVSDVVWDVERFTFEIPAYPDDAHIYVNGEEVDLVENDDYYGGYYHYSGEITDTLIFTFEYTNDSNPMWVIEEVLLSPGDYDDRAFSNELLIGDLIHKYGYTCVLYATLSPQASTYYPENGLIEVDWGDGTVNQMSDHTYDDDGIYDIKVKYGVNFGLDEVLSPVYQGTGFDNVKCVGYDRQVLEQDDKFVSGPHDAQDFVVVDDFEVTSSAGIVAQGDYSNIKGNNSEILGAIIDSEANNGFYNISNVTYEDESDETYISTMCGRLDSDDNSGKIVVNRGDLVPPQVLSDDYVQRVDDIQYDTYDLVDNEFGKATIEGMYRGGDGIYINGYFSNIVDHTAYDDKIELYYYPKIDQRELGDELISIKYMNISELYYPTVYNEDNNSLYRHHVNGWVECGISMHPNTFKYENDFENGVDWQKYAYGDSEYFSQSEPPQHYDYGYSGSWIYGVAESDDGHTAQSVIYNSDLAFSNDTDMTIETRFVYDGYDGIFKIGGHDLFFKVDLNDGRVGIGTDVDSNWMDYYVEDYKDYEVTLLKRESGVTLRINGEYMGEGSVDYSPYSNFYPEIYISTSSYGEQELWVDYLNMYTNRDVEYYG